MRRDWRQHVSDHFRLLTDVRPKVAAELIRELEMFRSVVLGVTGQSAVAQGDKIDVVLFARHRDFNALFGHGSLGFFIPGLRSSCSPRTAPGRQGW